jgi:hypothetical protein
MPNGQPQGPMVPGGIPSPSQGPYGPPPPPPNLTSKFPPGVKFNLDDKEYAGMSRGGEPMFLDIDQYGRRWDLNSPDIGYWDKDGKWHDVSRQDGVWQDTFTDKDGNKHTATQNPEGLWQDTWTDKAGTKHTLTQKPDGDWVHSSDKVPPPEVPDYLSLRGFGEIPPDTGPWTHQGDGHYTARDQYGRQWEWQRDADGNSKIGYKDGDGQWHELLKTPDGSWWESFEGVDGNRYWGSIDPTTGTVDRSYTDSSGTNHDEQVTPQHTAKPSTSGVDTHLAREDGEPTEGGDQQGQPPPIDPNATPVPMPSFPGGGEGEGDQPPPYGQFPMIKDPATGEWVPATYDPETGEFRPMEGGDQQGQPPPIDPNAQPMPMPSPDQFTTLEGRLVPPDSPVLIPGSPEYDPKAVPIGPDNVVIKQPQAPTDRDPSGGAEPGGVVGPLPGPLPPDDLAGTTPPPPSPLDDVVPAEYPEVAEIPQEPPVEGFPQPFLPQPEPGVPTLEPRFSDEAEPGPTFPPGLIERIEENPELANAVNQNPDLAAALEQEPTQVDQIEQDLGLAQPSGVPEPAGVTDPALAEPPPPEPPTVGHDLDDHQPDIM